jgi:hypothetical protein
MALTTMSIERLRDLRGQVDAAINAKITERRHELARRNTGIPTTLPKPGLAED